MVGFSNEQIEMIRDKTLYLVGNDDPFAKLGGKDDLLQYKMNARFFPDVGHGINHEIAEEINKIIPDFFLSKKKSANVEEAIS